MDNERYVFASNTGIFYGTGASIATTFVSRGFCFFVESQGGELMKRVVYV